MNNPIRLVVYRGKSIFDDKVVTQHFVVAKQLNLKFDKERAVLLRQHGFNAYLISLYITSLIKSNRYRKSALRILLQYLSLKFHMTFSKCIVLLKLRTPKKQFLDYKWNERVTQMVLETRELDYAMSWLSTLGGAFSALGEEFQHCAQIAGKISIKQFELALRLGNPLLVARCKLYTALSLMQQGNLKAPGYIIRNIYRFALDREDIRLQNMCQGLWAKLKYYHKLRKKCKSM